MDYLDSIQKYVDGKKYAGNTIRTSDGYVAYMTDTGISKHYPSMDVYNATANKNGCKSTPILLEPKWDDLGFAVGSQMVSGQSCGHEGTYVQSGAPKNDFDASYYVSTNSDLNITEEQALHHWTTTGKQEGRLPNSTILSSMASLGKVGYVDLNSQLHSVPSVPTGIYTSQHQNNVIGTNMLDCSSIVKYGVPLTITHNDLVGYINGSSILEFGTNKTTFFIQPKIGSDRPINSPVHYWSGESVSMSATSDNSYTTCGWWGCKVGTINKTTLEFQFGPGGEKGGSPFFIGFRPGRSGPSNTVIKYGDPVTLVAWIPSIGNAIYGYIDNNILKFTLDGKKASVFSFKNVDLSVTACNLNDLQNQCNQLTDCNGFIVSSSDNTWQPISSTTTSSDFRISATTTDVYVKNAKVNLSDKSCTSSDATMIDSFQYYNYVKGNDFTSNGQDQCTLAPIAPIEKEKTQYDQQNNKMISEGNDIANKFSIDNEVLWRTKNDEVEHALYKKTNAYNKYNDKIKKFNDINLDTYEQQKIDAKVLNIQNRIHAVGWAVLAIVTVSVVISRSK